LKGYSDLSSIGLAASSAVFQRPKNARRATEVAHPKKLNGFYSADVNRAKANSGTKTDNSYSAELLAERGGFRRADNHAARDPSEAR
jgi:hypothetical protein